MSSATLSSPELPDDTSRGSSVSTTLKQEYEELLKYAVVTPKVDLPDLSIYDRNRENGHQAVLQSDDGDSDHTIKSASSKETSSTKTSSVYELPHVSKDDVRQLPEYTKTDDSYVEEHIQVEEKTKQTITHLAATPKQSAVQIAPLSPEAQSETPVSNGSHRTLLSEDSPVTDVDLVRMETLMDEWCLDLKRNVLDEFSNSKMRLLERYKDQLCKDRERHSMEIFNLQTEIENLKEVLHTYEKSISQKDMVIQNMTGAIQKQREKYEQLQTFAMWRLKHNDDKRETFANKLAAKHYERALRAKVMAGWRGVVESKWKQRVERACQARAQEVCIKLTEDYEERLQGLQQNLDEARSEVASMHRERDSYEETMKKAFMRGVCALNMEAMTMFRESKVDPQDSSSGRGPAQGVSSRAASTTSGEQTGESARNAEVQPSGDVPIVQPTAVQNRKFPATKTLHVKASARSEPISRRGTGSSLPSTISSVLVERHASSENIQPGLRPDKLAGQGRTRTVRFDKSAGAPGFSRGAGANNVKVVE